LAANAPLDAVLVAERPGQALQLLEDGIAGFDPVGLVVLADADDASHVALQRAAVHVAALGGEPAKLARLDSDYVGGLGSGLAHRRSHGELGFQAGDPRQYANPGEFGHRYAALKSLLWLRLRVSKSASILLRLVVQD